MRNKIEEIIEEIADFAQSKDLLIERASISPVDKINYCNQNNKVISYDGEFKCVLEFTTNFNHQLFQNNNQSLTNSSKKPEETQK